MAEEAAVEEKEEVEEEPAMDDLDLFIDLAGDLGAFDNETAEADNATDMWNSSSSTSIGASVAEDDDILYTPLFLTVIVDNGTAADNNDTELYDDFLVDTSDDNDTAAAAGNGTGWEGEASGDDGSLFSDEDEAVVSLEPSSELEANAEPPLGIRRVCVHVMLLSAKGKKKVLYLKIYCFYSTGFCPCCWWCCVVCLFHVGFA